MTDLKEQAMGRFSVDVDLANHEDLYRARAGVIAPEQVRRSRVRGVVDSGAARRGWSFPSRSPGNLAWKPRAAPRFTTPTAMWAKDPS
jgi:hypothetical protein